jgi:cytochrome c-type biogenesis protein CcmE
MSDTAAPLPNPARSKWYAFGAIAVAAVGFALIAVGGIGKNLVYYWGPTELHQAGDKAIGATVRLGGLVASGSVKRLDGVSGVEFDVIDRKGGVVHVKTTGLPPQLFRERIGVVVEGTMTRAGYFQGNRLMISHNNEYRVPGEGSKVDAKAMMKTTVGLEGDAGAGR